VKQSVSQPLPESSNVSHGLPPEQLERIKNSQRQWHHRGRKSQSREEGEHQQQQQPEQQQQLPEQQTSQQKQSLLPSTEVITEKAQEMWDKVTFISDPSPPKLTELTSLFVCCV
jgi:hypothetical protein